MIAFVEHVLTYWPQIVAVVGVVAFIGRCWWKHEQRLRDVEEIMKVRAVMLAGIDADRIEIKGELKDIHIEAVRLKDGVHDLAILVSRREPKS